MPNVLGASRREQALNQSSICGIDNSEGNEASWQQHCASFRHSFLSKLLESMARLFPARMKWALGAGMLVAANTGNQASLKPEANVPISRSWNGS